MAQLAETVAPAGVGLELAQLRASGKVPVSVVGGWGKGGSSGERRQQH